MAYTALKMDEHDWRINFSGLSGTITDVDLLDYDQNTLESITDIGSSYFNVDISEYGDGSYLVKITLSDGTIDYYPIFDISDAQACYAALFKYILCNCDDPCDDCDDGIRARTHDMNSIRALIDSVKEKVYFERYQWMGIYSLSDTRQDFIEELGLMIDKLNIITDRCGLCSETDTNVTSC